MSLETDLKRAALASGRNIKNLAEACGIAYSGLHGFLTGERQITIGNASKLAKVLGLELRPVKRRK